MQAKIIISEDFLISKLKEKGVIYNGHFLLSSGKHSDIYINKDAIYSIPKLFSFIINEFSDILNNFEDDDEDDIEYDIITGPAIAGAVLAAPIANKLNKIFVYPEKAIDAQFVGFPNSKIVKTNIMKFRRGYNKIIKNKKVVVIEDVITTGSSVQRTIDAIELCGGKCVAILAIWNRTGWVPVGIKLISLINKFVESWLAGDKTCPLCKENNISLTDPKTGQTI